MGRSLVIFSAWLSSGIVFALLLFLTIYSWPVVRSEGLNLFTLDWDPHDGHFGLLSMLFGTLSVTLIALIIAVPFGIMTAILLSENLPNRPRLILKNILEILAGIPSIVYGLIGIATLSLWMQHGLELSSGRTLLTGGIILAIMILPTIITLVDDALQRVPTEVRESGLALGLYDHEITIKIVLKYVKSDIIGTLLLALGRAMGETMAVMLVIGCIDRIPSPFYDLLQPGQTMTSKIGRELAESSFGSLHFSALILLGLLLLILVLLLTWMGQRLTTHKSKPA